MAAGPPPRPKPPAVGAGWGTSGGSWARIAAAASRHNRTESAFRCILSPYARGKAILTIPFLRRLRRPRTKSEADARRRRGTRGEYFLVGPIPLLSLSFVREQSNPV